MLRLRTHGQFSLRSHLKQARLYFYRNWVQKLIVKTPDTLWVKQLHKPDGIVLSLCKTCAMVKAVLVPEPPCLIFRTASQILMPTNKGPIARKMMPKCVVLDSLMFRINFFFLRDRHLTWMQTALIILMTQNITLFFTHHMHGHFKQAHEKTKFKIAAGLFNSIKK